MNGVKRRRGLPLNRRTGGQEEKGEQSGSLHVRDERGKGHGDERGRWYHQSFVVRQINNVVIVNALEQHAAGLHSRLFFAMRIHPLFTRSIVRSLGDRFYRITSRDGDRPKKKIVTYQRYIALTLFLSLFFFLFGAQRIGRYCPTLSLFLYFSPR